MKIYINGQFYDKAAAKISVFDHGFLYGDGAFEGIRSYNRLIFRLDAHLDRLYETTHTLMIDIGMTKKQMTQAIIDTLNKNKLDNAYIRLIVTRGEGDLGLDPRKCHGKPGVVIIADNITLYPEELYENGMAIITVPTVRNHSEALNPQLKSLNYLNNIMAKIEATTSGFNEAIMLDAHGLVAECTGDNIFILKKRTLKTPAQAHLRGITRDVVLELAAKNKVATAECALTRHEMYNAEECFLTGTAAEIIPVVKIDGRLIADGNPGAFTQKLIKQFKQVTRIDGVKY